MKYTDSLKAACLAVGIDAATTANVLTAFTRIEEGKKKAGSGHAHQDTAMEDALRATFNFLNPPGLRMTATQACQAVGIASPTRGEQTQMGKALAQVTGRRAMKSNGRNLYLLPAQDTLP